MEKLQHAQNIEQQQEQEQQQQQGLQDGGWRQQQQQLQHQLQQQQQQHLGQQQEHLGQQQLLQQQQDHLGQQQLLQRPSPGSELLPKGSPFFQLANGTSPSKELANDRAPSSKENPLFQPTKKLCLCPTLGSLSLEAAPNSKSTGEHPSGETQNEPHSDARTPPNGCLVEPALGRLEYQEDSEAIPVPSLDLSLAWKLPGSSSSAPPSPPAPSLDCLGEDLLLQVLRLAQPTAWDLCRMATISRGWREACYNQFFWTKLRVGPGSMRPGVEQLALRCQRLRELHIDDPRLDLRVLTPILMACGDSLKRLGINCDADGSSGVEASICSVLWVVTLHCRNVETVELLSDGRRGGFGYLESKALWFLTSGFRNMRSFTSLCRDGITKQSLFIMVIAWKDLTCLRVDCSQLDSDDLVSLSKCRALRILELVGGRLGAMVEGADERKVSRRGSCNSKLEVMALSGVLCEPEEVMSLVELCPSLKRLLVSRESWEYGESIRDMAQRRLKLKSLQQWLLSFKGIELLVEG